MAALPAPGALVHRHRERSGARAGTRLLASETTGRLTVGPSSRPLTIEARADRIDEIEPGVWDVIDYKTGRVPTNQELEALFAPQLLLEAAMAERGGFDKIDGQARRRCISPTGRPTASATAAR